MAILIIMGLCSLAMLIIALFIKNGKGLMLISNYNTLPRELRNQVDKAALSNTAGNMLIRSAIELALLGVAIYFELGIITVILLLVAIIDPCVWSVITFRRMPRAPISKIKVIITAVITVISVIAMCFLFYYGEKEPEATVQNNSIQIRGMYGLKVDFSEIASISLIEESMTDIGVGRRNNGYGGFDKTLKGHFSVENSEESLLFVQAESSPTILIERNDKKNIYISFRDKEKTRALYDEMTAVSLPVK